MHDWLTIELVLGTLLVTSYACVGLLALWAAISPQHWFLRTAVVLAVLSPLLAVPAYEPFIVFVLQAVVIVTGVQVARWWRLRRAATTAQTVFQTLRRGHLPVVRFSLISLLLSAVLTAMGLAIGLRIPTEAWSSAPLLLLTGATFGLAALVAAWLVYGRCGATRHIVTAAVLCLLGSVPLAYFNNWPDSITEVFDLGSWPPTVAPWYSYFTGLWLAVVPAVVSRRRLDGRWRSPPRRLFRARGGAHRLGGRGRG